MKIDTTTIYIPGLSREYTFFHTSDCHIAYASPDENTEAHERAAKQTAAWSYSGVSPCEAMADMLQTMDGSHADGLFLCGDIADYCSSGTLGKVRELLSSASTELFYVCGNHERACCSDEEKETRGFYRFYSDLMCHSPAIWVRDFEEFMIVGIDNGDKNIRQEQLEALKKLFALKKPILVLLHIPIISEAILPPVQNKWGEQGGTYFLLGQPDDPVLSRQFCKIIKDPLSPIAAVFAGHIHLFHSGELSPGRMQYTSAPCFEGVIRKYVITGKQEEHA